MEFDFREGSCSYFSSFLRADVYVCLGDLDMIYSRLVGSTRISNITIIRYRQRCYYYSCRYYSYRGISIDGKINKMIKKNDLEISQVLSKPSIKRKPKMQ